MKEMDRLVKVMERLRGPGGCPWDAAQNHKSMIKGLIEEAYELADAIENENADEMMEELGDVLLQVVFHSIIAAEEGEFTLNDVANCLAD
ncbi:MAG: MazG nucleotide pyrophosphohydrolase domain-containing protein, partial [Desulfosalsimonadaceae bacterium]